MLNIRAACGVRRGRGSSCVGYASRATYSHPPTYTPYPYTNTAAHSHTDAANLRSASPPVQQPAPQAPADWARGSVGVVDDLQHAVQQLHTLLPD